MSTFKKYSSKGNYTLSVSLDSRNALGSPESQVKANATIIIQDKIEDLYLLTQYCLVNNSCFITWEIMKGK